MTVMFQETMVRRIDDLGRVVIPKQLRQALDICEGDVLVLTTNVASGEIRIRKYEPKEVTTSDGGST